MAKSIIKEILIIMLVCIAIVLVMAVIFYNFIPTNKIVPTKVTAYERPENIGAEISVETDNTFTMQEHDYIVEDSDLNKYKQTQSYNPGKPDPFEEYSEQTEPVENNTGNTSGGSNSTNTNTADKNVTDNYYTSQNVGKGTK